MHEDLMEQVVSEKSRERDLGTGAASGPRQPGRGKRGAAGRRRALRRLGIGERLLQAASASRGAWRMAANRLMQTGLSNATLRRYGFVMPSDLAARG